MYRATRPHDVQRSVTCECGAGGVRDGSRSILPEHEGQLSGEPVRSLAIKCSACAGLYVAGRGLRMTPPKTVNRPSIHSGSCGKLTTKGPISKLPGIRSTFWMRHEIASTHPPELRVCGVQRWVCVGDSDRPISRRGCRRRRRARLHYPVHILRSGGQLPRRRPARCGAMQPQALPPAS